MNYYEGLQLTREVGTMYTVAVMLEVVTKNVSAPSPDAARKIVAEAYKPSSIIVRKIKRTA